MQNLIEAVVRLDPQKPRGLPRGQEGEIRSGFEFFLKTRAGLQFITLEIREDPVLTAVTQEQFTLWKTAVAIHVTRIFKNGMWKDLPC